MTAAPGSDGTAAAYTVSPSPHAHTGASVSRIMLDVILALLPALAVALWFFGWNAARLVFVCVAVSVLCEWAARRLMGRDPGITDLSAVVTGLLLAFNLPPALPSWMAAIGAAVSIVVAKQLFGGIGYNPFNPALIGRVVLLASFPVQMTTWSAWTIPSPMPGVDAVTSATPLGLHRTAMSAPADLDMSALTASGPRAVEAVHRVREELAGRRKFAVTNAGPIRVEGSVAESGTNLVATVAVARRGEPAAAWVDFAPLDGIEALAGRVADRIVTAARAPFRFDGRTALQFFLGRKNGCIGEVSGLALLIGAVYLARRECIYWQIPVFFIGSVAAFAGVLWLADPARHLPPHFHVLTGGVIIGAFYMATDMVTSPVTRAGMAVFGLGCGVLTMLIRTWGGYPEGVSFAILLMNAVTPLINRATRPRVFGHGAPPRKEPAA